MKEKRRSHSYFAGQSSVPGLVILFLRIPLAVFKALLKSSETSLLLAWSAAVILLPLLGALASASPALGHLMEFPPRGLYIEHAPFSSAVFSALALVLSAFLLPFVRRLFAQWRAPNIGAERKAALRSFPPWGFVALLFTSVAWIAAWTHPNFFAAVQIHTFFPLWLGYILVMNAMCLRQSGSTMFGRYGIAYLALFPASAVFWWLFEYLNRFVQNWSYQNIEHFSVGGYVFFATLSFSTVLPAVAATKCWLEGIKALDRPFGNWHKLRFAESRFAPRAALAAGFLGLFLVPVLPDQLFPMLWIAPVLLLAGIQTLIKQRNLFSDLSTGDWRPLVHWALAACFCGVFWELWNFYSIAKWRYHIPYVEALRIFEMPILGYTGYLPFGILCGMISTLVLGRSIHEMMHEAPSLDAAQRTPLPEDRYVLLINPFYPKNSHGSFGKHVLTPSLALTSLVAATPSNWRLRYWDENLLQGPPPCNPFPQVVAITVHLTFAKRAYELARWFQQRGAVVILGGQHVQSLPEEAQMHADAIALGEGAQVWLRILSDIENGSLRARYEGDYETAIDNVPQPRRDLISDCDFLTTLSLTATRGCHNRCGFCYLSTAGLHMPYRKAPVESVVREFCESTSPYGVFLDNNLSSDVDYLLDLSRALGKTEKIWSAAVSLDIAENPKAVRAMAEGGCTGVFVGLETLNAENLKDARKRSPHPDVYARAVDVFHRFGIQVNASFVLGFDHDGPDVFDRTVDWIEAAGLACATFHILTPYPRTPLFRRLLGEGRLLHQNWDLYDTAHAVFRPKHMSEADLEEGYTHCYERLFSHRSIWKRRPLLTSELLPYLAMTYLYKKGNWFWPMLIRHRLTGAVWHPLVELSRQRHIRNRSTVDCEDCVPIGTRLPFAPGV